jgi:hypothetical protein
MLPDTQSLLLPALLALSVLLALLLALLLVELLALGTWNLLQRIRTSCSYRTTSLSCRNSSSVAPLPSFAGCGYCGLAEALLIDPTLGS